MRIQCLTIGNECGAALLQMMFFSVLLGILVYASAQFMNKADQSNMRLIRRNSNLTSAILLSDQVSSSAIVKNLGTTPSQQYP